MKKYLLLSLVFLIKTSVLFAQTDNYDIEIDGIFYTYDTDNNTATVVRSPYDSPYTGDITIPATISQGRFTFEVTTLGRQAFSYTDVTSVKFIVDGNKGIKYIEEGAFMGSGLVKIELPSTLQSLGKKAFVKCEKLTDIKLPEGIETIPFDCFSSCKALQSITLPESVKIIEEGAFSHSGLTSITFPKNFAGMNSEAFGDCYNLASVKFNDDCAFIGLCAFIYCTSLTSVELPKNLWGLESGAFEACPIKTITIPASTTYFKFDAFEDCDQLKEIIFEDSDVELNVEGSVLEDSHIEKVYYGRTHSDPDEFYSSSLSSLTIGPKVTDLPYVFSDNLKEIYSYITDPSDVTEHFSKAAKGSATLYVPKGTMDLYINAPGWKNFFFIEEFEQIKIGSAKQVPYCSEYNLDFTDKPELKAYVATGYDKDKGTIFMTRVKQVPAETGFLLVGEEGTYEIPVSESASDVYYLNSATL